MQSGLWGKWLYSFVIPPSFLQNPRKDKIMLKTAVLFLRTTSNFYIILLNKTVQHTQEEWRKLVVKSTVVPQLSARLRDR